MDWVFLIWLHRAAVTSQMNKQPRTPGLVGWSVLLFQKTCCTQFKSISHFDGHCTGQLQLQASDGVQGRGVARFEYSWIPSSKCGIKVRYIRFTGRKGPWITSFRYGVTFCWEILDHGVHKDAALHKPSAQTWTNHIPIGTPPWHTLNLLVLLDKFARV